VKVLLDTSVLIAALVEAHPRHAQAFLWLQRIRGAEVQAVIAAHAIAETYAMLTVLPVRPPIAPSAAWTLVEHSVLPFVETVDLSSSEVREVIRHLSRRGLTGGVSYDALIAETARKAHAECIITLNGSDFQRVVQEDTPNIREP
jgi:predicted nucleic acid-binding protein